MAQQPSLFTTLRAWLYDKFIEHWPTIFIVFGGVGMTYLASISDWLSKYGPIAWGAAGLLSALAILAGYSAFVAVRSIAIRNRFNALAIERGSRVNPLSLTFERERIFLNAFVLPAHQLVQGKTFIGCEIIGPANCVFTPSVQTHFTRSPAIDAVWMNEAQAPSWSNVIVFHECVFRDCSFQRVTLYVDIAHFREGQNYGGAWLRFVSTPPTSEQAELRRRQLLQLAPAPAANQQPAVVDERKPAA